MYSVPITFIDLDGKKKTYDFTYHPNYDIQCYALPSHDELESKHFLLNKYKTYYNVLDITFERVIDGDSSVPYSVIFYFEIGDKKELESIVSSIYNSTNPIDLTKYKCIGKFL